MSYNCENAFDTIDTPNYADEEFLPHGTMHWTRWRFNRKMQRIAQVILAANMQYPLDLAVLQEVESDSVMEYLINRTSLHEVGYRYVLAGSNDSRGVRVAVIYYPYTFHLLGSQSFGLSRQWLRKRRFTPTRDILHVWGEIPTFDTLDVFALHLPSKLGAKEASIKRQAILQVLRQYVDSVRSVRRNPRIVIAGDFNDRPHRPFLGFRNLMQKRKLGSYKFHGVWNWIDQIWINDELDRHAYQAYQSVKALRLPLLLEGDEKYGGEKPFRTYYGPAYHGGFSDHLPVVIHLQLDTLDRNKRY